MADPLFTSQNIESGEYRQFIPQAVQQLQQAGLTNPTEQDIQQHFQLGGYYQVARDIERSLKYPGQILSDEGKPGQLEGESFAERSALPATGTPISTATSYFDERRGVQVNAPIGEYFELYSGGGVRRKVGQAPAGSTGAPASSLFTQPTQADAQGNPGAPVPGFKKESLAYEAAAGKTIARTGETIKNPETGVDVKAQPGNIMIEYTDGMYEERPYGGAPGTPKPIVTAGPTKEDLGIDGEESLEDKIIAQGLKPTSELELIGKDYQPLDANGKPTGSRRTAKDGYMFYQDPTTRKILERPESLKDLAKPTQSPSILAERQAAMEKQGEAGLSVENLLSQYGFDTSDPGAFKTAFTNNPLESFASMYSSLLDKMGITSVSKEISDLQKDMRDLDNQYADDVAEINNDPWLVEGVRQSRIQKLQDKYEMKRGLLVNQLQLFQSYNQEARQTAQFVASAALQQYNADRSFAMDQLQFAAQREDAKIENQMKLEQLGIQKENLALDKARAAQQDQFEGIREVQGGLFDLKTGKFIIPPKATGGGGGGGTQQERLLQAIASISPVVTGSLNESRGTDGYADPGVYTTFRSQAAGVGVDAKSFDTYFSYSLSPEERTRLFGQPYRIDEVLGGKDSLDSLIDDMIKNFSPA